MTTTSNRRAQFRAASIPWVFRPWTIFAANVVCLAINWWTDNAQYNWASQFTDACGKIIGMSGPVTAAVIVIFTITALSIVLTITWCVKKVKGTGRWGASIGTALFLILFTLFNMLIAGGDVSYLSLRVPCSGP